MKRILIYVSDHGFGHASRTIALVRELLKKLKIEVVLKNSNAYDFLVTSLPQVQVIKTQTDVGPTFDSDSDKVDVCKTFDRFQKWIDREKEWISREIASFTKNPADLILTDISPIAIKLADKLRYRCVTVGNFTWIDILNGLPFHEKKEDVIKWLEDSFSIPAFGIKLPLSMRMEGFSKIKRASLLCRNRTKSTGQTLAEIGLKDCPITIYLGKEPLRIQFASAGSIPFAKMNSGNLEVNKKPFVNYFEGQNLIAASRFVIAKPGYSTIAECVKFRRPMYLIPREDYPEDSFLCKDAKELGIAQILDIKKTGNEIEIPSNKQIQEFEEKINQKMIKCLENLSDPVDLIKEFIRN